MSDPIHEATATPSQLVEIGIGYIAKGVFRLGEAEGPAVAAELAMQALHAVRLVWSDFDALNSIPHGRQVIEAVRFNPDGTMVVVKERVLGTGSTEGNVIRSITP